MARNEIKICGFGGQGIITLGRLIAFAAHFSGKGVVQTVAYGQESRGGSAWADVVIDDEEVDYPKVTTPDVLILFSQEGADRFCQILKNKAKIIYDPLSVLKIHSNNQVASYPIQATIFAREVLKSDLVANSLMFGAFVKLTGLVQELAADESLQELVPQAALELNRRAFLKGAEIARELSGR